VQRCGAEAIPVFMKPQDLLHVKCAEVSMSFDFLARC